jgi:peptide/nickel transport system permease protein
LSFADSSIQSEVSPVVDGGQLETGPAPGISPWALARRRLRRNKAALGFGVLFVVLVGLALAAPLWAQIADTTPARNHLSDTIVVGGKTEQVVSFDGVPIGPTWQRKFFLGADNNGRDVAVRLLYGARNSLFIGIMAALITTLLAVILGTLAGYFRGWTDAVISRGLDIAWAFPPTLLGVALGVSFALGGLKLGPLEVSGDSLWIPTLVIGLIGVVYLARPIRGQVLSLREKEFVEAARAQGAGPLRIMFSELLPNVASTILVFFPLLVASAILNEAALSFLGAGVQPPAPSWGTMLADGVRLLSTAPHLTIVPGLMLVLTVLSINVFGDGVRDALDPRSKIKVDH